MNEATASPGITRRDFGTLPDGRAVTEYTLDNGAGLRLSAINLGGIVTAILCPDRDGRSANVVLGLPTLDDYVARNPHFGTIVGRHANRIAGGRLVIDGVAHPLSLNDGPNALHGGPGGFGTRFWPITPLPAARDGSLALQLNYRSADGEEGYPGQLDVRVRYTLTTDNCWRIDYQASTDRTTVINLTHHDYFNLAGGGSVLDHRLTLAASRFAAVDATLIPEALADVAGTPFDFRESTRIGARLRDAHPQIVRARGYDHHWVLDRADDHAMAFAARLVDPGSGRVLEIETTEPGLQFYSGNFLDGSLVGSGGQVYRQGDGLCLETQHPPNAPHMADRAHWPDVPSTLLRPGDMFRSSTVHRFGLLPRR
ncbi:aldose epimerase family protein [Aquabacterium sp.]|uniref:aldose epimerase family protein n=1 Tax=Aquabacterium sp. TaxID=1872578 RepID=UPI002C9AAED6|nr:aldose epimerase family protein [Aquabacterium sp.]HSW03808.1 aldose epimerase family protein [Aquabacterium sp.]